MKHFSKGFRKVRHYQATVGTKGLLFFLFSKVTGIRPILKKTLAGIRVPLYVRVGTTDVSVLKQVFIERHYDFPLAVIPKIIIDAGANIGLASIFFANKYPDSTIIAVEPESSNFELLLKNVAPYPNVKPVRAAIWNVNGQIRLFDPGGGHHGFQIGEVINGEAIAVEFVEAITLDSLMARVGARSADILKIDIEGAEKEVFENCAGWIEKVNIIMAELHDHLKAGCSRAFCEATTSFDEAVFKGETVVRRRKSSLP